MTSPKIAAMIAAARVEERERCAMVAERKGVFFSLREAWDGKHEGAKLVARAAQQTAAAIRALGDE
jgi:hypothetical protein